MIETTNIHLQSTLYLVYAINVHRKWQLTLRRFKMDMHMRALCMVIVQKNIVTRFKILADQPIPDPVRVFRGLAHLVYRKLYHIPVMDLVLFLQSLCIPNFVTAFK